MRAVGLGLSGPPLPNAETGRATSPLGDVSEARTDRPALDQEEHFGTIARGLFADLVVLSENPIEDIRNSRSIEAVFKEGRRFDPVELMSSVH
ncbi:MAG: hypothetical protein V3R24_03705 [Gemmatimonadales bacterium]